MFDAGNGSGSRIPVLPVLFVLLTAVIGGLSTWLLKVDDRLFSITRDVPTRQEIQILRSDLTTRLDRIDANVAMLLAGPRLSAHP